MAEVDASAAQGQGEAVPKEGLSQSSAIPHHLRCQRAARVSCFQPFGGGFEDYTAFSSCPRARCRGVDQGDGGSLNGLLVVEEHRALIGMALQGFQCAKPGMHEVFKCLIRSFEVCFLVLRTTFSLRIPFV